MAYSRQTVPPAGEPVTTTEAKAHLKIASTLEDEQIAGFIKSARALAESYTGRQFLTATWALKLDDFPSWEIEAKPTPLIAVSSIVYVDSDGDATTLDAADYQVSAYQGLITPAYGESWPITRSQMDAVTVTFTAGYGTADDIPQTVRQAILMQVGEWVMNREPSRSPGGGPGGDRLSATVMALLDTAWDGKY
jgi:uncharacterized phiE125 gp8 family phage protein